MNIALIGYRGTGKTTVARLLADALDCEWVDADAEIERVAGKSIAEIFATHGEPHFRDLETEILRGLCERPNTVCSLGGGAVVRTENREILAKIEHVAWLQADVDTIHERISADEHSALGRPNLTIAGGREEIAQVLADRTPVYRECAAFEVDTSGKSPAEVAREILAHLSPDTLSD